MVGEAIVGLAMVRNRGTNADTADWRESKRAKGSPGEITAGLCGLLAQIRYPVRHIESPHFAILALRCPKICLTRTASHPS